jgi:SAM-dependent methyltransferase
VIAMSAKALSRAQARHDYENVFLRLVGRLDDLLAPALRSDWSLLDIGCGYHAPLVALFDGTVRTVRGVDVERVFLRDGRIATFKDRRRSKGLLRAAKWATIRYGGYAAYYQELSRLCGRPLDLTRASLSTYDGQTLPFDDGGFDAIVSNAVLEHVADLESFVDECARVLRPGGAIDMVWHNFYCPSGSHMHEDVARSDPWGHVVGRAFTPDLNRKRPEEFRAAFEARFDIARIVEADRMHRLRDEEGYEPEGSALLTDSWRRQLASYPEDLLTTRSYLIQARLRESSRR